jgi:hypothetical protein
MTAEGARIQDIPFSRGCAGIFQTLGVERFFFG